MNRATVISPDWPSLPGVQAMTVARQAVEALALATRAQPFSLGRHANVDQDVVTASRAKLVTLLGLPAAPRWLRQVHGTEVLRDPGPDEPQADAAVTTQPGMVLWLLTADCLPVVFAAEDGSEIGAAHAGWRGLSAGVLEATVAAMQAPAGRIIAWLGPAAGPQAYEVGQEVFDAFVSRDAGATSAFTATRPGHWRVDLYALARMRLQAAGLDRIHGGGLCTISDPQRFFSHRRDPRSGRMATLVWRQDPDTAPV